jgi:ParB family transcriptional regulator, chromosome partitioning protein
MQVGSLLEAVDPRNVKTVPIASINHSRFNIRSELGDLKELEESIAQHGLLSPIIVRTTRDPDYFELVSGSRRLEAMRELGHSAISAIITDLDEKSVFEVFLAENLQRETLTPLEEARAFYAYIGPKERKCFSYGKVSELARKIGKSQEYISTRIKLLRLSEVLMRRLFEQKNFTVSHAEELASLSDQPDKVEALGDLLLSQKITVRELEKAVPLIKAGIDIARAVELAKVECSFKMDGDGHGSSKSGTKVETMLVRSKLMLESALSYIDNAGRDLECEPEIYESWIREVRLKVHDAIDGIIGCEKIYETGGRRGSGARDAPFQVKLESSRKLKY